MENIDDMIGMLYLEAEKLHEKYELSQNMEPDFFEPIMLEYLDKFEGITDRVNSKVLLRFDSRGTRYDGRTEQIEKIHSGEAVRVERDPENKFNCNNFRLFTENGIDIGNMPAELCNVIAPLYDKGITVFERAHVSFVDPISGRSRYAKQAILFVEASLKLNL